MMKLLLPLIGAWLLFSSVSGQGICKNGDCSGAKAERSAQELSSGYGCAATINVTYIPGSQRFETLDGYTKQVVNYSVSVTNTASCLISGAQIHIDVPGGANIIATYNLNQVGTNLYDLVIPSYGIAPQSEYSNANFAASFDASGYALTFDASVLPACMSSCIITPTTSTTCRAETSISLRSGSSGVNSTTGDNYATYDVLVVNIGGCAIYKVALDISVPSGVTITSTSSGLEAANGGYTIPHFTNNQGLMQGDTLPVEGHRTFSFTASFTGQLLQKFVVSTTSYCAESCSSALSTVAPPSSGTQCSFVATANYIPGTGHFVVVSGQNKISAEYSVFFANYGFCNLASASITFAPFSGSSVSATTYLTPNGDGSYQVQTEYIQISAPGGTNDQARITVIYEATGYAREIPVSNFQYTCGSQCVANPSSASSDQSAESSNGKCSVTATASLRTTWISGSTENRLYDFTITNTGSSAAVTADISLAFSTASVITQSWNVQETSANTLQAKLYSVAPGSSFRGAGYVLTIQQSVYDNGFTDPVVTVTSTQC